MLDGSRIDDLRRRVQEDPASIAFAQLAEEYRRAGQLEQAIDACRAGLSVHAGYLSARVTLGRALLALHRLDEAGREFAVVLESAPDNVAAVRGLADIHQRRESRVEAAPARRTSRDRARRTVERLESWLKALNGPRAFGRA